MTLAVVNTIAGDYNSDGIVNAADYAVWRDNLGSSITLPGDTTPGSVTQADYLIWKTNFGVTAASSALVRTASAVPEPSTVWLLGICLVAGLARSRARNAARGGRLGAIANPSA